ncbi:DUF805 domain-containing protein [Alphaproteobacteria bacterium]|nr:DUF805 domain-containing protein [Alphaproteobacteria bacterium]
MITSIWRLFKKSFSTYANVSGRSGRAEFWVFVLGSWVLIYAVSALTWGAFWVADPLFHDAEYSDTRSDHHERKGDWRDGDRHEDDWRLENWSLFL